MSYKTTRLKKILSKYLTIFIVLWLVLTVVLVAPLSVVLVDAENAGLDPLSAITDNLSNSMMDFSNIFRAFGVTYRTMFFKILGIFSLFFLCLLIYVLSKQTNRGEYRDIEHGSSGWSEGGEQYKVLSKHSGIILAEKNYLPVDKRGNINVLVVGRFWIW